MTADVATGLDQLRADLIARWDFARHPDALAEAGFAMLQALPAERPPRGGLAVGEGIDPATGKRRIELRLHAEGPRNRQKAEQLRAYAQLQGFETVLRIFSARPKLSTPRVKPPAASTFGGSRRPLHIGASIAHESGSAGTLGAFVRLREGALGVVSCSHVLARAFRKRARTGDDIQQPGAPEAIQPDNRIGTLTRHFSLFQPSKADNLDAAVAVLTPDISAASLGNVLPVADCIPPDLRGRALGQPLSRDEIEPGMAVIKLGRTSGFTSGRISLINVDNFKPDLGAREAYTFGSVVEVSPTPAGPDFATRGDSGALVVTQDGLRPVGIHFCSVPMEAEGWTSYLIPWWRIVSDFPISLA